jgi:hypothetical protein
MRPYTLTHQHPPPTPNRPKGVPTPAPPDQEQGGAAHTQRSDTLNKHTLQTTTAPTPRPREPGPKNRPAQGSAAAAMLASTIQFTNTHPNTQPPTTPATPPAPNPGPHKNQDTETLRRRLRSPRPARNQDNTHPAHQPAQPARQPAGPARRTGGNRRARAGSLFPQDPIVRRPPATTPRRARHRGAHRRVLKTGAACDVPPTSAPIPSRAFGGTGGACSLERR